MKITRKLITTGLVLFMLVLAPFLSQAQTDPGCMPCACLHGCRSDGVTCCPIDSGVWILLSFGALYGLFMAYKLRMSKKSIRA